MLKFSHIFKNKKLLVFAFLFVILIAPIAVNAQSGIGMYGPSTTSTSTTSTGGWSWLSPLTNMATAVFNAVLVYMLAGPIVLAVAFGTITKIVLNLVIVFATTQASYTHSVAVNIGWPIVRDLANMMVVLGFVVIGIATALRIKEYEAKQLLAKLIVAALLINFSLLICGIFIDGTNILMNFFFGKAGDLSTWVVAPNFSGFFNNISLANIADFAPKFLGMAVFNFLAGLTNLLYALLILCRVLAIWMLVILAPLAFVCNVFPATKAVWQMWMKNFFQWCIVIIPAGLFYYIGSVMISKPPVPQISPNAFLTTPPGDYIANSISTILVPGMFLIIGFMVSLQFSAAGVGAIMGFANKHKSKIMSGGLGAVSKTSSAAGNKLSQWGSSLQAKSGAGNKIGGWMAQKLGGAATFAGNAPARAQKVKSWLGRQGEAIGAIQPGTVGVAAIKDVEEEAKGIKFEYDRAKLSNDRKTIDRIRNDAINGQGTKGAASYKVVSDAKDLTDTFKDPAGNPDYKEIHKRGRFAEINGAQGVVSTNEELNPDLLRYNEFALEEKAKSDLRWSGIPDAHKDPLYRPLIQDAVVADGFRKAGPAKIKNFHKSVLSSPAFIENVQTRAMNRSANTELNKDQVLAIKSHIPYLHAEVLALQPGGVAPALGSPNYERWKELSKKLQIAINM